MVVYKTLNVASVIDIALIKVSALSSRGSKKDFLDLFFLRESLDWIRLIGLFENKYSGSGYNLYHIIRSLTYFDDALNEPDPRMIEPFQYFKEK